MNFNLSQRIKMFDEDKRLLTKEFRDRWLLETAQRRKANADMERLLRINSVKKKP